jgi:hypothetical protein
MQAFGMRYSHDSYARSQATMFANELIERMHANTDGVANGDYADAEVNAALNCSAVTNDPAHPTNAAPDCAGASTCSVTELAQLDFFRTRCGQFINGSGLVGGVENLLPGGSVAIECTDSSPGVAPACEGDDTRTVTITWQDPDEKDDPTALPLQVQVNSRIL